MTRLSRLVLAAALAASALTPAAPPARADLKHLEAEFKEAIERVLAEGACRTPDLGGSATTEEVARAVHDAL